MEDYYPTFTASFPGHPIDETYYVDQINKRYPFRNFRTFPTANQAYESLKDFVYTNDEPTTNPSFYSQLRQLGNQNLHFLLFLLLCQLYLCHIFQLEV